MLFYVIPFLLANPLCKISSDPSESEERETVNLKLMFHSKLVLQISSLALKSPRRINTNTSPPPNALLLWLLEELTVWSSLQERRSFLSKPTVLRICKNQKFLI